MLCQKDVAVAICAMQIDSQSGDKDKAYEVSKVSCLYNTY